MITRLLHAIVAQPRIYDLVQKVAGFEQVGNHLSTHLAAAANASILDVGGGTGNWRRFMPNSANYLWLDCDSQKLTGYRANHPDGTGVMADATTLCFGNKSVDYALMVGVAHHLTAEQLSALFSEVSRVVRRSFIFLDPVDCQNRAVSKLLWRYDRGRFPRTSQALKTALANSFDISHSDELTIYHRYTLCVAQPKN